jgi:hypothetical protein
MKQIIVVSESRPGMVAEITEALAGAGVNIDDISAENVGGTGIVLMTVDRYDEALRALAQAHFQAVSEDAIVIRLADKPGELARITARLNDAGINLRSIRIIRREGGTGIIAVATQESERARELLKDVIIS